jgi:hypothetical protein
MPSLHTTKPSTQGVKRKHNADPDQVNNRQRKSFSDNEELEWELRGEALIS